MFHQAGFTDMKFYKNPIVNSNIFIIRPYKGERADFIPARKTDMYKTADYKSRFRYYMSLLLFKYNGIKRAICYWPRPEASAPGKWTY